MAHSRLVEHGRRRQVSAQRARWLSSVDAAQESSLTFSSNLIVKILRMTDESFSIDRIGPRYNYQEANRLLKLFTNAEVLELATDHLSIHFHARRKLRKEFEDVLEAANFDPHFLEEVNEVDGVITGDVIDLLLSSRSSQAGKTDAALIEGGLRSVEICVPAGALVEFVGDLRHANANIAEHFISASRDENVNEEEEEGLQRLRSEFFANPAVSSVAELSLTSTLDSTVRVVVIESKYRSALAPILHKRAASDRRAICKDGLFDFEYRAEEPSCPLPGFRNRGGIEAEDFRHTCFHSLRCPLTWRSTLDSGVRFVPFTESAALAILERVPKLLAQPPMRWRIGVMYEEEWCESGFPIL
ncbi:hypothetical protein SCHPADRAFT_895667 [Schizopora paradoxa]|uniref:Uncharacterized protein n=1 Tax=Schizopora paradoxa TaxID=27342 RepID=A0A0H2R9M3_9AGAM|nr:hypothetical protein SCHPADRAFT_895667 [Schizopora paradoxa]